MRELARVIAERAGLATDTTAEPGSPPGMDVAPGLEAPARDVATDRDRHAGPDRDGQARDASESEEPIRLRSHRSARR